MMSVSEVGTITAAECSLTEYKDLVVAINSALCVGFYEIYILPNSHPLPFGVNVLVEDNTISLTKNTLIKAFVVARQMFFESLGKQSHPRKNKSMETEENIECQEALKNESQVEKTLLDSSSIMLLTVPEHFTASNTRKRVIMAWENESQEKGRKRILMDLWMVDNMLVSPLNKHTKSPNLWAHRKWLTERLNLPKVLHMASKWPSLSEREGRGFHLVALRAAEIHPRNYYAWAYMRNRIGNYPELLYSFGQTVTQCGTTATPFGFSEFANVIKDWCLKHPSDTSGWSFLVWLFTIPGTWATDTLRLHGPFEMVSKNVLDRSRSLYLRNEALWSFLRTMMASKDMPREIVQVFSEDAEKIVRSESERLKSRLSAGAALSWLEKYGSSSSLP